MPSWSDTFSGYSNYRLDMAVSLVSQDVNANTSRIGWSLKIVRTGGSGTYRLNADSSWAMGVNANVGQDDFSYDFRNITTLTLGSGVVTREHESDGTLTVGVAAWVDTPSPLGDASISGKTFTLPTIPRATTPTYPSAFDAGSGVTISLPRASSLFTHDVTYKFGSASGSIASGAGVSASWTPPLSLLTQIPTSTSGGGDITVVTKNGSTVVGTVKKAFTLRAPSSVVPTISAINAVDDNPDVASLIGAYVQGQSRLKATVVAAGAYGSTIKARKVTVDGQTVDSGQSVALPSSGTRVVAAAVTDSRGRSAASSGTINVLAYDVPQIIEFTAVRATPEGTPSDTGKSLLVTLNASVSSLVVGSQKNAMTITIATSPRGGAFTDRNVITPGLTYNNTVLVTGGDIFATTQAWDVRVTVADKLNTVPDFSLVSTAGAILDATGDKVALGKMVEASGPDTQIQGPGRLYDVWDVDGRKVLDAGDLATNAETQTGTATDKVVTPASLASRTATESRTGVVEFATQTEVNTGSDTARAVTPKRLRDRSYAPYSMAAGSTSISASGGTVVDFPSGRFTQPPIITATADTSIAIFHISSITATSARIRMFAYSGTEVGGTAMWQAIQMTSANAGG